MSIGAYYAWNYGMDCTFKNKYVPPAQQQEKREEKGRTFFRMHPPRGGFDRNGIKMPFKNGGVYGNRKEKINLLIRRMI